MMAPALPQIAIQYHIVNDTEVALLLSIFMLSYALSPLFFAPLSEMFGRIWVGFPSYRPFADALIHGFSRFFTSTTCCLSSLTWVVHSPHLKPHSSASAFSVCLKNDLY
jgi:MFS family permease